MKKVIKDPVLGDIIYTKRIRCRSIRIKVSAASCISVSLPFWVTYATAQEFVDANRKKIVSILSRQKIRLQTEKDRLQTVSPYSLSELAAIRSTAKKELPVRLEHLYQKLSLQFPELDFSYNKVFIKNNRSNWGSCSSKRNINLNMHLVNLPEELRDYIIVHELCHLIHRNHGAEFHKLVDAACGGKEKEYTRALRKWMIR